jgi:hypothetical protein
MGYSVSGDLATQPYRELAYSDVAYASLSLDYRLVHLLPEEENTLTTVFLPNLASREAEVQAVGANLTVDTAGPFKRNPRELSERKRLYNDLRIELCNFLGFPCGPAISTNQLVRG